MKNEKYLELARKLKALADKGIDGEKYNAQKQLDKIMKKYGIRMEDLELQEFDIVENTTPEDVTAELEPIVEPCLAPEDPEGEIVY